MSEKTQANSSAQVEFSITLTLTVGEAKALKAIVEYGPDLFVKWFYENHGKHYLQPHEREMRSLFNRTKTELPRQIKKIEAAEIAIAEALKPFGKS